VPKVITPPKQRATAFFRVSPGQASIDAEGGILRGVKLMEVGKLATFSGPDGKAKSVTISPAHIDALLAHAGNRAIPIHWTHEWHDKGDRAELEARIGAWKNIRRDETGNAIADAYLSNTPHRENILWSAEHNPEDMMASAVFNYDPSDALCLPQNFRAADLVPCGAATTALFTDSTETQTPSMDINELIQALADPKVQEAVNAIIKSHKSDAAAQEEPAAAEMESAAGVTDEDKKEGDEAKPAMLRAQIRATRAFARLAKAAATADHTALLAEVEKTAKASATALLGKGSIPQGTGTGDNGTAPDTYVVTLAKFTAVEANPVKAAMLMLRKHPELLPAHEAATRARLATLTPQP